VQRLLLFAGTGGFALYGLGVIVVQVLSRHGPRVMLPAGSGWTLIIGLLALAAGSALAVVTTRGWWRVLPLLALTLGTLPLLLGTFLLQDMGRPTAEVDRITLPDGQVVMLGVDPVPTDVVYSLWRAEDIGWRPVLGPGMMTYSEDGSFTADPRLVLTSDGKRLLIRRGGIWTDCFDVGFTLKPCAGLLLGYPGSQEDFLPRSAEMERLIQSPR
jgi:hypothetical protein